jgi:hypothetical protein
VAEDFTLPSTGIKKGQRVTMVNNGANSGNYPIITMKSSDGDVVRQVYPQTDGTVIALQDTPTDGTHWAGLGTVLSSPIAYTPVYVGFGTVTPAFAVYVRRGDLLDVWARATSGVTTATTASFSLPTGLTTASSFTSPSMLVGEWLRNNAGAANRKRGKILAVSGTSVVNFTSDDQAAASSPFSEVTGSGLFSTSEVFALYFTIPISGWSVTKG